MRHIPDTYQKLLQCLGITVFAFILSSILMSPFSISIASLISTNDKNDFNITDFYNIIADGRAVRDLDRDIVVIDINGATRDDVACLLDAMPDFEPRVVGVDICFDVPHEDDSLLLAAIAKMPDLVMVADVEPDKEHGAETFHMGQQSFFHDRFKDYTYGAPNLPTKMEGGVVRQFVVGYPMSDGSSVFPSFPMAIADKADPKATAAVRARGNRFENINYPSRSFTRIPWTDVAEHAEDLRDKVVLIGAIDDPGDVHATPPQDNMSGIEIHALAISTILSGQFIDSVPEWINIAIAAVLCFLMTLVSLSLPPEFKSLALRLIQLSLLYVIIRVGYFLFIDMRMIVNFSYALMMMTFEFFAIDIWFGSFGIFKYARKRRQRRRERLEAATNNLQNN